MTDEPPRRIDPDPYPSGIYSTLSYPSLPAPSSTGSAVSSSGAAPIPVRSPATPATPNGSASGGSHPATGETLARIGDIEMTATTIRTAAGEIPLAGATITLVEDRVRRTPTWAVVCAIVGFFVVPVLSLLFLLVRETVATGSVRVIVDGGGLHHETVVSDAAEVDLARSLAAS
jgi:hypothetical protein